MESLLYVVTLLSIFLPPIGAVCLDCGLEPVLLRNPALAANIRQMSIMVDCRFRFRSNCKYRRRIEANSLVVRQVRFSRAPSM